MFLLCVLFQRHHQSVSANNSVKISLQVRYSRKLTVCLPKMLNGCRDLNANASDLCFITNSKQLLSTYKVYNYFIVDKLLSEILIWLTENLKPKKVLCLVWCWSSLIKQSKICQFTAYVSVTAINNAYLRKYLERVYLVAWK